MITIFVSQHVKTAAAARSKPPSLVAEGGALDPVVGDLIPADLRVLGCSENFQVLCLGVLFFFLNLLIRTLHIENLVFMIGIIVANVTCICSDKTGTLTQNVMTRGAGGVRG